MQLRTIVITGAALVLPVLGAACGDDGSGGTGDVAPTGRIVEVLEGWGMEEQMAECLGRAYEAAGFSAADLESVGLDGIDPDDEKYRTFAEHAQACTTSGISVPGAGG